VFAVAGVAKVLDRDGARRAVAGFGVPRPLAGPVVAVLPVAEMAVAVALVDARSAVPGAVAAIALLVLFMAGIAIALARGRHPDCRCFGALHSAAVGRKTIARDAALAAGALLVAVKGPGTGVSHWASNVSAFDWLAIAVAMVLAIAFVVEGSQLVDRRRHRSSPGYPQTSSTGGEKGGEKERRVSRPSRRGSSGR
jgi:methylamine utilization protein MauE